MPTRPIPDKFLVAFSFAGEQREAVRAMAVEVEKELGWGKVFFDEWFEHYIAGADADLKLQAIYARRCVLAVVCVSGKYGGKPWTCAEYEAIRARQMEARNSTDQRLRDAILPIRVGEGDVGGLLFNTLVPDVRTRPAAETADLIIARYRLIEPTLDPVLGEVLLAASWPKTAPALVWPMADHGRVRAEFGSLLTSGAPWGLLPIRGSSETGKSHITKQMLADVIALPGIACGRFDFKGTTGVEAELSSFVQFLEIDLPPSRRELRLNDRLGQVLEALKDRATPVLLIFDTYEAAGEAQDWVDKNLLPNLLRCPWLRVVIAGQRVPDAGSAVWRSKARSVFDLSPPRPEDWLAFGELHKPNLTLQWVRQAHELCSGKASPLAQLLGPTN